MRDRIDDCIGAWIGLTLPTAARLIERSGWRANARDDYCHRCGDSVGIGEVESGGCGTCRGRPALADSVVRLGAYEPPLRDWIVAIKFRRWDEMALALGEMLAVVISDEHRATSPNRTVVVPAPMPPLRRLHRGIDHARVIATGVARALQVPLVPVLARADGPPQVTRTASARRRLGGRGLRLRRHWGGRPLEGLDLILVDDVRTTGGTLRPAVTLLRRLSPARISVAVLAVAGRDAPATGKTARQIELRGRGHPIFPRLPPDPG
ncbi:MAG: ComF family protein [Planctomycetota bacterium]|jgi:predicted amidophosphoribosyltransferase